MRFCLAAVALVAALASQAYGGQLYQFTSTVNVVLGPPSIPGNPFASGQSVVGTFRYSPELAVLPGGPSGGTADYRNAFSELKLAINLGSSFYRWSAPDLSTFPFPGVPLNYISVQDNIPIDGGGRSDTFVLAHSNFIASPGQPMGALAPSAIVGQFYPANFSAFWNTDTLPGQSAFPSFITDFSLLARLNELFPRSASDNWSLRFDRLPGGGQPGPDQSFGLLGRMTTLQVIPEPCGGLLAVVGVILMAALRSGRGTLRRTL